MYKKQFSSIVDLINYNVEMHNFCNWHPVKPSTPIPKVNPATHCIYSYLDLDKNTISLKGKYVAVILTKEVSKIFLNTGILSCYNYSAKHEYETPGLHQSNAPRPKPDDADAYIITVFATSYQSGYNKIPISQIIFDLQFITYNIAVDVAIYKENNNKSISSNVDRSSKRIHIIPLELYECILNYYRTSQTNGKINKKLNFETIARNSILLFDVNNDNDNVNNLTIGIKENTVEYPIITLSNKNDNNTTTKVVLKYTM